MNRKLLTASLLSLVWVGSIIGQDTGRQWTKREAQKILDHSPWSQTQTDTDTSEMVYSPTTSGTASIARTETTRTRNDQQSINNNRADRGATNQAISVNYHVRLLSAKPIRKAFKRVIELSQDRRDEQLIDGLNAFVDRDFSRFIVVAITLDSTDSRFSGPAQQAFASAAINTLRNKAYLERRDGKRVFVSEYHAPIDDGLGAKFIFPRLVDDRPFLDLDSVSVRFYCELTAQIKLSVTFKVSDFMFDGRLEY